MRVRRLERLEREVMREQRSETKRNRAGKDRRRKSERGSDRGGGGWRKERSGSFERARRNHEPSTREPGSSSLYSPTGCIHVSASPCSCTKAGEGQGRTFTAVHHVLPPRPPCTHSTHTLPAAIECATLLPPWSRLACIVVVATKTVRTSSVVPRQGAARIRATIHLVLGS